MNREYQNPGAQEPAYFVGREVERTPAFRAWTLFCDDYPALSLPGGPARVFRALNYAHRMIETDDVTAGFFASQTNLPVEIRHVYLTGNCCYRRFPASQQFAVSLIHNLINPLLRDDRIEYVTLEIDHERFEHSFKPAWHLIDHQMSRAATMRPKFIPMLSVNVAAEVAANHNFCLKLDEQQGGKSQGGVYTFEVKKEFMFPRIFEENFTPWDAYGKDWVLLRKGEEVPE